MLIADDLLARAKALYPEVNRRKALETALIALEIYETWLGPRHPATMNCYAFVGLLLHCNQEPETGIRMIREAISYDEERYGHICDPLAEKYMYLAGMPSEDVEHCLSLCHQVADYYQRKKNYPKLVEALTILFYKYQRIENNLPAYAIVKKTVDLFEANLPPGHPDLLKLNVVYADILCKMGEKRESIMVHDRALKACIALHGVFHQHTVLCYDNLINQCRSVFAFEPTLYYMKKKARILEVLNGRYHSENSFVYLELARFILLSRKGAELAIPYIECALRIARSRYRKVRQKELYIYYETLALALIMIDDLKRALRMTEKAFRISMRNNGFHHRDTAKQFERRARIFKKAGVKVEEIHNLEMALYIYTSLYGDDSYSAQNAQKALDEAKSSGGQ